MEVKGWVCMVCPPKLNVKVFVYFYLCVFSHSALIKESSLCLEHSHFFFLSL